MAAYRILFKRSAVAELEKIPRRDLGRIVAKVRSLGENPRPEGCQKLSAQERYRIRQGDFRIVYAIMDEERTIVIFKIGHRSDVYRQRAN